MKIAIDVSPLRAESGNGHRVRGIGFYVENLLSNLRANFPMIEFVPFSNAKEIPIDVDLIHFTYLDPFFLTLPLVKKKRFIVTVHDMIPLLFPNDFPSGLRGRLKWKIQETLLLQADHVITVSHASCRDLINITGMERKKITVIYNAASDVFGQKMQPDKLAFIQNKYSLPEVFVLYVGDVTPNKNVPRLITSLGNTNVSLELVGKALVSDVFDRKNPWNRDRVRVVELVKKFSNIFRLGFVPEEDLVGLYRLAKVFVMPSLYEGFGLPILEAMKSGTPVVTSKRGSLYEVAGDAAYYVDPESEVSIREAVVSIIGSKSLADDLSGLGREQVKKFSWKDTARFTKEVYERVYNS